MLVQLILEQHGFELCGSTYLWAFFNSKYDSTPQSMLVESKDVEEPHIWRADFRLYVDFELHGGLAPPNPRIVQGSAVVLVIIKPSTICIKGK